MLDLDATPSSHDYMDYTCPMVEYIFEIMFEAIKKFIPESSHDDAWSEIYSHQEMLKEQVTYPFRQALRNAIIDWKTMKKKYEEDIDRFNIDRKMFLYEYIQDILASLEEYKTEAQPRLLDAEPFIGPRNFYERDIHHGV